MKVASEKYITIKTLPHVGEPAIPTGKVDGDKAEFIMVHCIHGEHRVWLTKQDI